MTYVQLCANLEGLGGFYLFLLLEKLACILALAVYMYSVKTTGSRHSNFTNVFLGFVSNLFFKRRVSVTLMSKKLQSILLFCETFKMF